MYRPTKLCASPTTGKVQTMMIFIIKYFNGGSNILNNGTPLHALQANLLLEDALSQKTGLRKVHNLNLYGRVSECEAAGRAGGDLAPTLRRGFR